MRKGDRPISGTRLIREWQGVEHTATVLDDGFEYQGRRYKSLSAIARAITGTRWSGPLFWGLRNHRGRVPGGGVARVAATWSLADLAGTVMRPRRAA